MIPLETNSLNNFIAGWINPDYAVCNDILNYYNKSNQKFVGRMTDGVDIACKNSTDCLLDGDVANLYYLYLSKSIKEYIDLYPFCNFYSSWYAIEPLLISHYKPGGGYYTWHTERAGASSPYSSRHLVFMTYLNNVDDEGETEWYHQKIKIKPQKGLTVIWPADWTFTHRGITSNTKISTLSLVG